jgi:pimeloyl-ACP methyl ester carboxylesterase
MEVVNYKLTLSFKKLGEGPALIIVHGLYGSSDNWFSIGKELSKNFEVFLVDQRNHGRSPHSDHHTYELMKLDLLGFMDGEGIEKAILVGHSMGGKTVMSLATDHPDRVNSLVVIDIAPKSYLKLNDFSGQTVDHLNIMIAMLNIDLGKVESREDVDLQLSGSIPSSKVRSFLLKNLKREPDNSYIWRINIETLSRELPAIMGEIGTDRSGIEGFPVLFIRGEKSSYLQDEDIPAIKKIFPFADFVTIPGAGHWLHVEKPALLVKTLKYFLLG